MLADCVFIGPLLSEAFVTHELLALLDGIAGKAAPADWGAVRGGLAGLAGTGGPARIARHVLAPLLGGEISPAVRVKTQEGLEDGGLIGRPRAWPVACGVDLETPSKRGDIARSSPVRRAIRVLRARGEQIGMVTNGEELRLILSDPAGGDSQIAVRLTGRDGWRGRTEPPVSFRLIIGLIAAERQSMTVEVFEAARLHQTAVTRTLRGRGRLAIEAFLAAVLERNKGETLSPAVLWREALTIVYRLLFILKLESASHTGQAFSFAATKPWRRSLSPNRALGPLARRHLDAGHETGQMLEDGLRTVFQVCREGLTHADLSIAPLAGGLFDPAATATIDRLMWGDRAVALLLDKLLWTEPRGRPRERVHFGALDVEVLGQIYESLLDLTPDVAREPMTRVRRGRVEAVVPAFEAGSGEPIAAGSFYTRTGLGRRSGGAYYTPHGFVSHLVRHTLTPLVTPCIEAADPTAITRIKVLDPAMGSGHFLVESCRFLGAALYEASCRRAARGRDVPDTLAPWLPGRARDRTDSGPSRGRALAICRRMVTTHCLYGVDRDPLAVELAKLSLWLESFAEGLPLTFLDHRLIAGDSIAGPFVADMSRLPVGGAPLDPLLARGVEAKLALLVKRAMREVDCLDASIGTTLADLLDKQTAKGRLDRAMAPLIGLARAWSGAAAMRTVWADDAWLGLAQTLADGRQVAPDERQAALSRTGAAALPLDLIFPDVFRPGEANGGFHAVLGNPPWDVVHYQTKEYLAGFDPAVMEAPTKQERLAIERHLLADPAISAGFEAYKAEFVERKRLCDRLFPHAGGGGSVDLFQVFTERMADCLAPDGAAGLVVPSSFHANAGTAHLRRRFLDEMTLESCFSFENRRKLFDIHGRQKFALVVARRGGPTRSFRCGFYLDSIGQVNDPERLMTYDRDFLAATGGGSDGFLELSGQADLRVARHLFLKHPATEAFLEESRIQFGREAHMTDDAYRFIPIARHQTGTALPLHEGKTFHQFTDRWKASPRYAIPLAAMEDKPTWLRAAGYYRLAFREIARSNDERTMIAAIIPPGYVFGHKGTCEKQPWARPDSAALILAAIFNAFSFDWCVRRKAAASVSLFLLRGCPVPNLTIEARRFLAHGALRLSCQHAGFEPLWHSQTGSSEPFPSAPAGPDLRAAVDATVAWAFGLSRVDYQHILTGFNHKADPSMPDRCLTAFDELLSGGARKFFKQNDPIARFPLVQDRSQPTMAVASASAILIPSMAADMMPPA